MRGKKTLAAGLVLCVLAGAAALVAAGDPDQTLVPLSYLTGTYIPDVAAQGEQAVDEATQTIYQSVLSDMQERQGDYLSRAGSGSGLLDQRLKYGDAITLPTGAGGLLLTGSGVISYSGGAVVDVTAGNTVASGSALTANHRYVAAENTRAVISVTSDTAVVSLEGGATVSPSTATDYNALAKALSDMGLFRGTGTGYGSGYDLERTPTRIEGLVMFLRLLGEEQAALASTARHPFADVPDWADRYVAYAYDKGYTKGVGSSASGQAYFGTESQMGAGEYLTFLLRALGYRDSGSNPDFTWQTALDKARETGVLTAGEYTLLQTKLFLRAQVAYVSYYALDAAMADGSGTLLAHLASTGALDATVVQTVRSQVTVTRIA